MTTATGQYTIDFAGQSAADPWAPAGWESPLDVSGYRCAVIAGSPNVLMADTRTGGGHANNVRYIGSTYSGTTWTGRIEIGDWSTGDAANIRIGNTTDGTGYFLFVSRYPAADLLSIRHFGYWHEPGGTKIADTTSFACAAGDVIEFSVTNGSPCTFSVKQNGVAVTNWDAALNSSVYTITTPAVAIGLWDYVSGVASIRSAGIDYGPGSSTPAITDVDGDETISPTQVGVVITGTGFGASQGTGSVKLAPTDSLAAGLSQTVTAWSDTSITFTASGLPDGSAYLFVTNNDSLTNASGFAVTLVYTPIVLTWTF